MVASSPFRSLCRSSNDFGNDPEYRTRRCRFCSCCCCGGCSIIRRDDDCTDTSVDKHAAAHPITKVSMMMLFHSSLLLPCHDKQCVLPATIYTARLATIAAAMERLWRSHHRVLSCFSECFPERLCVYVFLGYFLHKYKI